MPSSKIVTSAAQFTSQTKSAPICFKAAIRRPSTFSPTGALKLSPSVTRTAGAKATTVLISGSFNQSKAVSVSSFSESVPVGQTSVHWPHCTHLAESAHFAAPAMPMPHFVPVSSIVRTESP